MATYRVSRRDQADRDHRCPNSTPRCPRESCDDASYPAKLQNQPVQSSKWNSMWWYAAPVLPWPAQNHTTTTYNEKYYAGMLQGQ